MQLIHVCISFILGKAYRLSGRDNCGNYAIESQEVGLLRDDDMDTCIPVLSGTSETFAVFFYRSRHGLIDANVYGNITSCSPAHSINLDIVSVDRESYPCKALLMTSSRTCRYICDCPTGEHCSHLTAMVHPSGVQGQDDVTICEIKTFWGLARNDNKTRAQFTGFNIQWNLSITTN